MAEEMNDSAEDSADGGSMTDGAASVGSMLLNGRYLAVSIAILFVAGLVCVYFGVWTGSDVQADFDTIIGVAIRSLGDGLLVGAGILGAVGALVAVYRFDNREQR